MKTIYKYPLLLIQNQQIETFKYCSILSAQLQNGEMFLWLMVDTSMQKQKITVNIFGTGQEIPKDFHVGHESNNYAGLIQMNEFVWHIFVNGQFTASF